MGIGRHRHPGLRHHPLPSSAGSHAGPLCPVVVQCRGRSLFLGRVSRDYGQCGQGLGVHYPPVLVLVAATALLFVKSLTQDMDRCRREQNMRRLAQRLAMLEARLEAMEKKRRADTEEKPVDMPETDEKHP